ncbi:GNAT family N-acetyltransferase [Cronobacter muytjensii]|uniref:Protein ElaA n=1 Tax=Cronobacter muytjensii TaxID=413501 RepID=A0A2T7APT1_9ENTR|nr:GNAT family N-acetyltransferase [Cronobacter muytjensii]EKS1845713.1 GNAT family N-acetyltransferase [Cronobacter muytjensii]ELY3985060.1 GNAT family N-acetyltransferase [Cronobacter muytjensii]ELY4519838.1 GNAT family N-acetyltransferase [Cronobacter muytjensii]KAB0876930.1 GNAT family N-acetyltransferase [Cronobacter muytjensii]MBF4813147.1 GNAT family N-acetyltransferase [Cronobacter muytjensii]
MIDWQDKHHTELDVPTLYALLKLRCEVFVVEQTCPYLDVDGEDLVGDNRHLLAWRDNQLIAYARILKSNDPDAPVAIGRVIVSEQARGEKLGVELMKRAVESCERNWPQSPLYLSAQAHLQAFYAQFGFTPATDSYDEDGIPHIGMRREPLPGKKA